MDNNLNWDGAVDGDDGDREEEERQYELLGKDAMILLIDCTKDMFLATEGEETAFELSLKCARNVMSGKIISSAKDLLGIVMFGTEKSENVTGFNHITVFQELVQPGAEKIIELDKLITDGIEEMEERFGHSNDFSMSDALWTCSSMFSKSETKVASKRILIFTNNDDPHEDDEQLQIQSQRKATDLQDLGIYLDLMHIQKPDEQFDMHKFYKDIISLPEGNDCDQYPDASRKFEELLLRIKSKNHVKRKMNSIFMTLGDGLKIGIGVYTLARSTSIPTASKVFTDTNEELKSMRKTFLSTTGEVLFPSDIKKYVDYSGKTVTYNQEELKEISQFFDPGLVLLGFKPRKILKLHHFVKPSHFIYPTEDEISGGTAVFSALLTKCLERDVIGICRYVARANSMPQLVALIPQGEEMEENKVQRNPPGFHLLVLPFADDIRHLGLEKAERADSDQIDKASKIIRKLKFKYDPGSFENPVLQTHWRNIEVLALEKDNFEDDVKDYAKPDYEKINRAAKPLIDDFKNSVFPEDYEPNSKKPRTKATVNKDTNAAVIDDKEIRERASGGTLNKLTVPKLKQFCMSVKIKVTGKKKDELIDDILQYFTQNP